MVKASSPEAGTSWGAGEWHQGLEKGPREPSDTSLLPGSFPQMAGFMPKEDEQHFLIYLRENGKGSSSTKLPFKLRPLEFCFP